MPWQLVIPVLDKSVRSLCVKPYPNHPKGCPNWNKKEGCPPKAKLLGDIFDLAKSVYLVYNRFDFGSHVERMRERHPEWSQRQVECCLYWQGTARKQLRAQVEEFLVEAYNTQPLHVFSQLHQLHCPEACGVDITATMKSIGIDMEWPPKTVTYQVALVGFAK
jgi:predicted metal-binding protein